MRRNRLRVRHRLVLQQLDLFAPPNAMRSPPGLTWEQLPEETRETVARLMARLLVDHVRGDRRPRPLGGRRNV